MKRKAFHIIPGSNHPIFEPSHLHQSTTPPSSPTISHTSQTNIYVHCCDAPAPLPLLPHRHHDTPLPPPFPCLVFFLSRTIHPTRSCAMKRSSLSRRSIISAPGRERLLLNETSSAFTPFSCASASRYDEAVGYTTRNRGCACGIEIQHRGDPASVCVYICAVCVGVCVYVCVYVLGAGFVSATHVQSS